MSEIDDQYLLETVKSFRGLKSNAEKAMAQINEKELHFCPDPESNSVAILIKHLSGNMVSRFTDFLTTDGEKSWRERDNEFVDELLNQEGLMNIWNKGWKVVFDTLSGLTSIDLSKVVYIRGEEYTVLRALQRQLVHYAYHTGQIVYICKLIRSIDFTTLSIAKKKDENDNK